MNDMMTMTAQTQMALMQASQADAGAKAKSAGAVKNMKQIEEAAQDFEAMFLTEMIRPMFSEVNKPNPTFGGGKGEEVFNGMMLQEYGKIMARAGGVGLAEHVKAEMIRIQEGKPQ